MPYIHWSTVDMSQTAHCVHYIDTIKHHQVMVDESQSTYPRHYLGHFNISITWPQSSGQSVHVPNHTHPCSLYRTQTPFSNVSPSSAKVDASQRTHPVRATWPKFQIPYTNWRVPNHTPCTLSRRHKQATLSQNVQEYTYSQSTVDASRTTHTHTPCLKPSLQFCINAAVFVCVCARTYKVITPLYRRFSWSAAVCFLLIAPTDN